MQSYHLGLELGDCNNEVAALQSDHSTEVPLYTHDHLMYMFIHISRFLFPHPLWTLNVSVDCPNGQDIGAIYDLSYASSSGTFNTTLVVNQTGCSNGTCRHELQNNSQFDGGNVTLTMTTRNISYNVIRTISELFIVYNSCKNNEVINEELTSRVGVFESCILTYSTI